MELKEENSIVSALLSLQIHIGNLSLFTPTFCAQQLPQTTTPDKPKKNIIEAARVKKKMKTAEEENRGICIYVCEREVGLQLDNQLSS